MPVVLTLQSGEALARSSNLISAAPAGTRNAAGQALCLDTSTSTPMLDSTKYDIGDPGYATLNVVPDVDFYPLSGGRSDPPTSVDVFCTRGGSMKFHDGGWHQVDLPANGIIVSANALNSVSSRVDIWEQFWP